MSVIQRLVAKTTKNTLYILFVLTFSKISFCAEFDVHKFSNDKESRITTFPNWEVNKTLLMFPDPEFGEKIEGIIYNGIIEFNDQKGKCNLTFTNIIHNSFLDNTSEDLELNPDDFLTTLN